MGRIYVCDTCEGVLVEPYINLKDKTVYCSKECADKKEVTEKDCSPAVLDMLANLSQRIVSLERAIESTNDQLDTLYRNQVEHGEGIAQLDARSKVLETPDKYEGETITIPRWLFDLSAKEAR